MDADRLLSPLPHKLPQQPRLRGTTIHLTLGTVGTLGTIGTLSMLDPINGISLERYAELAAKMKDCGGDLEVCARIAQENGVDRATWEAAMSGWNARMYDPQTAGTVALAYMPLYQ